MPCVADFLIERMANSGIQHIFGVPGDYVSKFSKKVSDSDIEFVFTTQEESAAFAADAYSRTKGIGGVCISQNSILKIGNAVACAKAERSPVVIVCGAPTLKLRSDGFIENTFKNLTCATAILDNPSTAGYQIDSAFEKMKYYKQPIFIELLQDIADKPLLYDVYKQGTPSAPETDKEILEEALQDVVDWINEAQHPVILAGVELSRYGLGKDLLKFAERANIPIVTTLLSKSVVSETHPLSVGVYVGSGSNPRVQDVINESDCLLMLGVNNHGGFNYVPNKKQSICCSSEGLQVKNHQYINIGFEDFICNLFKTKLLRESLVVNIAKLDIREFRPKTGVKITMARLFEKINSVLNANLAVVADVGDALLGACELIIHQQNNFIATANYPSMGFAIPAALGLQTACPKIRPIIIVGDGAFQMSCMELGTIVSRRLNPIVLVLNNGGYASDRINGPFNDIHEWDYQEIVKVISGGQGAIAENEQELHSILSGALVQDSMYVINVKLDSKDISPVLLRMRKAKCNKA